RSCASRTPAGARRRRRGASPGRAGWLSSGLVTGLSHHLPGTGGDGRPGSCGRAEVRDGLLGRTARRPEEIAVALTGPDRPRAPLAVLAGAVVVARRDRPRPVRPPSGACGGQEVGGAVRALPREVGQLTPEVAVGRRLPVDRPQQVEVADDRGGAQ